MWLVQQLSDSLLAGRWLRRQTPRDVPADTDQDGRTRSRPPANEQHAGRDQRVDSGCMHNAVEKTEKTASPTAAGTDSHRGPRPRLTRLATMRVSPHLVVKQRQEMQTINTGRLFSERTELKSVTESHVPHHDNDSDNQDAEWAGKTTENHHDGDGTECERNGKANRDDSQHSRN